MNALITESITKTSLDYESDTHPPSQFHVSIHEVGPSFRDLLINSSGSGERIQRFRTFDGR